MRHHLSRVMYRADRRKAAREQSRPPTTPQKPVLARMPDDYGDALLRMMDLPALKSPEYRRKQTVDWQHVHPLMKLFATKLIHELEHRGLPFYVHNHFRGMKEQERLFREKRTRARWGKSAHNWGMAVDIVHFKHHWNLTEKEWAIVGQIGKDVARKGHNSNGKHEPFQITWGGDWDFYDPAHWELANWRELKDDF